MVAIMKTCRPDTYACRPFGMKITVTVPNDLGNEVMARTDDISAFVSEAVAEKLARMRQSAFGRSCDAGCRRSTLRRYGW